MGPNREGRGEPQFGLASGSRQTHPTSSPEGGRASCGGASKNCWIVFLVFCADLSVLATIPQCVCYIALKRRCLWRGGGEEEER